MNLAGIDTFGIPSVVILQTPSTHLQMFVQDKLKSKIHSNQDSVIDVTTKKDIRRIKEVLGIYPPMSSRWFVAIDLDKLYDKNLVEAVKQASTCCFLCTCSKYKTFKEFKQAIKGVERVCDLYITFLRRADLVYIYDALVPKTNPLSKPLFDYVAQGYSSDIDTIFDLFIRLNKGEKFESKKAITDVCGLGGLSIESFIFSLTKELSGSAKGLNLVIKNRIKAVNDLAEDLGYTKLYNYLAKSLLLLCELKMLIISGVVYKDIRKLPSTFDEKALSRYKKYIWRLKEIPMSELLQIRQSMGAYPWRSELDAINFIYRYYSMKGVNHVSNM